MLAWVTPDDAPGDDICIKVYCPAGSEYEAAMRGAILSLTEVENWEKVGAQSPQTCADAFFDAYQKTLEWRRCMAVGTVFWFAGDTPPEGSLVCDGSTISFPEYQELYDVIGTTYGGGGRFFNVPDLRDKMVLGAGGNQVVGDTGGEADVTLTESQMPSHKHDMGIALITGGGLEPLLVYSEELILGKDTGDTGGDGSHNNVPPFLTLLPCIVYQ